MIEIDNVIKECDEAFDNPVSKRSYYQELLKKITDHAMVLKAENLHKDCLGYIAFYANDIQKETAYITLLAVNKSYQGKGIGKKLLAMCEDIVKDMNFHNLRLEVHKDNKHAIKFYGNCGFYNTCAQGNTSFYMEKNLELTQNEEVK